MQKYIHLLFFTLFFTIGSFAQDSRINTSEDQKIKKGLSFGVFPTITYNSDLGFQYGGLIDLYNYGEGDIYQKYYSRYFLEISRFTKSSGKNHFSYESNRLIIGRTFLFDVMYQPDEQFDFLSANGYESVYNSPSEDMAELGYKSNQAVENKS